MLSLVIQAAEITNPAPSIVDELDKGVDVSTTFLAADDRLLIEVHSGDFFTSRQLSVWLDDDGEWNAKIFGEIVIIRNAICSDT